MVGLDPIVQYGDDNIFPCISLLPCWANVHVVSILRPAILKKTKIGMNDSCFRNFHFLFLVPVNPK